MNTKVEEALGARCEAAFVAIETAANTIQYDYRGGHGAELLLPLRDARTIIVELNEHIAQQDATIARMREALERIANQGPCHGPDGTMRTWVHWSELAAATLNQGEVK